MQSPNLGLDCCDIVLDSVLRISPNPMSRENSTDAFISRILVATLACGLIACTPSNSGTETPSSRPPNIILIMADDLGAETIGCYGNTAYSTPRLDQMANEGARFENAFSTPVCTPTRAMILTGLHPNRTGFLERLDSPLDTDSTNRLPVHLTTFAQVLQSAGYATAIAGKWHLGSFQTYPDQPASHGFDEHSMWVQYWDGERRSRYYSPHVWENGVYTVHREETYGPDYYSDFLIDFIERNQDRPFLAYYPMNLIHGPLVTPPSLKALAESKYPENLGNNERRAGHMITYMDAIVGKFLDKVKELGLEEDTLIIFTGDNGTSGNLESRLGSFRVTGGKRTMNEAGTRVPLIARWPGTIPPGKRNVFFSLMDVMPTLCAVAQVTLDHDVDGMDLSHSFWGKPGIDSEYFSMAFEGDVFFVRDKRFRLHEDGRMYDVPVASSEERYSMDSLVSGPDQTEARNRLQARLDSYMTIRKTDESYSVIPFGTGGDRFKNAQDAAEQARIAGSN